MHLRPALLVVPVLALLKLSACADQGKEADLSPDIPGNGDPDASADGQAPEVPYAAPCKVTKSAAPAAGRVIKGTLLLPDSTVDGELFIDGEGFIACADASCSSAPGYAEAAVISCGTATISPGLINPHDHITFADNPPHQPSAERYEHRHDWRKGLRGHTKIGTREAKIPNTIEAAELRFAMTGVTSAASAGGADGLIRNVDGAAAQLEGLKMTSANSDTFPLKDGTPKGFPTTCDGFPAGRTKVDAITKYKGYLPHISEGLDLTARAEFTCQSDGEADPTHDLIRKQTAVVHGMAVNADDVARYRADQAALIWSPRSNIDLYGNTAPVALYENLGVQIALGTDWLPSGSMNMARELRCADELNQKYFDKKFSDKQLWQMVTINAAFAIGAQNAIGQLKKGFVADVAVFANQGKANPYRAVIEAGVEDVALVIRGGQVLYGDAEIAGDEASGGGSDCEDLDVCGIKKKACVKRDLKSKSLADVQAAATSIYPLFFCKKETPKDEPSCVPTRGPTKTEGGDTLPASAYSGIKDGDKDGDGVGDAEDNCPTVFNPIRPVDGDKQPDTDGDGIGDACDKCPLDSGESCTPPSSNDIDGDGVPNGVDDCPEFSNPDQAGCAVVYTIATLRNPAAVGHPDPGTRASVKGVWVTGVKDAGGGDFGYFIQETGTAFAGMFVATPGSKPTLKVGNNIDVEGDYEEVYGMSQLSNPVAKVVDPGTTLPFGPIDVDPAVYGPAGAAGEPWEGMLCRVPGPVSVSVQNSDGAQDHDEFGVVTGVNLRVDDNLYDALGNDFAVGTSFPQIVGICAFSFNNRKIWPRSQADLQ